MFDPMTTGQIGQIVTGRLRELGHSQAWLGQAVGERTGRRVSQSTVSAWLLGTHTPSPAQVFAIEDALVLKPGSLSRGFGYLPVSARAVEGVEAAVRADPGLSESGKRALLAVYRELRS